jgi:hypothetical protein
MSSKKKVFAVVITTVALTVGSVGMSQAASKAKIDESVAKGVQGNYKNGVSDGFMLGGQFVIDTDGTILLDHRQAFVGDDEERDGLLEAILKSKAITTS